MVYGKCGVITSRPNVVTNEFMFDLGAARSFTDDVKKIHPSIANSIVFFMCTAPQVRTHTDNSTTSLFP
jgi:hypothetical protein